jgi:cold shock CspA family protein
VVGRVVVFDDDRGLGEIEADDGRRYSFHCTAIADGTRTIPVDAPVDFEVTAGPLGGYEAGSVRAR